MHTVLLFRATNDRNGNPCRVFCAFDRFGQLVGSWDEGIAGTMPCPLSFAPSLLTATQSQ